MIIDSPILRGNTDRVIGPTIAKLPNSARTIPIRKAIERGAYEPKRTNGRRTRGD